MQIPSLQEPWKLALFATALTVLIYAAYVGMVRGMGGSVAEPDAYERRMAIRHLAQSMGGMMAMHPDGTPARFRGPTVPSLGPADCTRAVTTGSTGTGRAVRAVHIATFTCFEALADRDGNPILGMMILRNTAARTGDSHRWTGVGRRLQVHSPHERDYHPALRAKLGLPVPE